MEFSRIGKYEILGEIGQGSMGQVFKAHDPVLGRDVALKTISSKVGSDEEMRKRFQREAQAAARLNHPNIVTVHDFGEEQGQIYIAMELLDGVDLKDFMTSGALTSLGAKLTVMDQILEALAYAHSKGVVHRDLKPANVHVLRTGQLKLMDFGLARIGSSAADTTKAGTVLGTPNYMSPEQVMGERADFRSDVFSAGAVFYEILSGRKPFDAESVHAVLFQVAHKEPEPLRKCAPDVPAALAAVVQKALSKEPAQRYSDAAALRGALGRARAGGARPEPIAAPTAPGTPNATLPPMPHAAATADPEATMEVGPRPRVQGSGALAPAPRPTPRPSRSSPTLSARAATQIDPARVRHRGAPPARSGGSMRRLVPLVLLLGVASGVAGAFFVFRRERVEPEPPSALPPKGGQEAALARRLAATQAQLAQRDLDDKDYVSAIKNAEQALKVDARNPDARRTVDAARLAIAQLDAARSEAAAALDAGETQKASDALSRILSLDPRHPVASELTSRLNGVFRTKAEDARRLAAGSRSDADKSKAGSLDAYGRGTQRAKDAEAAFGRGEFAAAAQSFLEARDAFDRARRAASPASAPTAPPTAAAAETVPPPTAAAATAPEPPPVAASLPAPAAPVARPLVAGRTVVQSARAATGGVTGFQSDGVSVSRTPDQLGRIDFDVSPAAVKPGDVYLITVKLANDGRKDLDVRGVTLVTTTGANASKREIAPPDHKVESRQRVTLAEVGGVWDTQEAAWSLEVVVTAKNGDTFRNRLDLK